MKKASMFVWCVSFLALLVSCSLINHPRSVLEAGSVAFQFPVGRGEVRALYEIDDAVSVVVSIKDSSGNEVYSQERLELYRFGESYISEALSLSVDTYTLEEFFVVDADGVAIFATPAESSPRAYLVDDPLPIDFSVSAGQVVTVSPEILDTEGLAPEEFGYGSFVLAPVETIAFLLAVFEATGAGNELTEADVLVTGGTETLFNASVPAQTNTIEVRAAFDTCTVRVEKNGYDPYEQAFTPVQLSEYTESPLIVTFGEGTGAVVWRFETVDGVGSIGNCPSLDVDASGSAHICYSEHSDGNFNYATNASGGSWVLTTIDSDGSGGLSSLTVDTNARVHVSYFDNPNAPLTYATNASGSWVAEVADATLSLFDSSIALDSLGGAHISYWDRSNYDLKYATNASGSWMSTTVDGADSVGSWSSIAVDTDGAVHVSYYDATNGDLKYACNATGTWITATVDSEGDVGYATSIAVDAYGAAHISYWDSTNTDLKYATNASGGWVATIVDSAGDVGIFTSLGIDAGGSIHISYGDTTNGSLKYATNGTGSWIARTVDGPGVVIMGTSLAVDAIGFIHIGYCDYSDSDLKYATTAP